MTTQQPWWGPQASSLPSLDRPDPAEGPWWLELQSPRPPPVIAWAALMVGGEATVAPPSASTEAPPTRWRRRAVAQLATREAALQWAHAQLSRSPSGWSVRLARVERGRWGRVRAGVEEGRFTGVHEVREAARALAGWSGEPPELQPEPEASALQSGAERFTAAQRRVIEHHGAPAVVVAVAGAGKTTTLVARVAHLVAQRRLDPQQLLLLSFSRAAVATLQQRLSQERGCEGVDVRTFHSLAHHLRATHGQLSGQSPPQGPPPEALVARVAELARRRAAEHDTDLEAAWRAVDLEAFSRYRGRALAELRWPGRRRDLPATLRPLVRPPPDDPRHPHHPALFEDFEAQRQKLGWSDFDQSLAEALIALHRSPALLAWARGRWRALIVDEAQDVSPVQHATLAVLFGGRQELMYVGDDDQSIYGFRGAAPGLMLAPATAGRSQAATPRTLTLPEAFRCRAEMLAAATSLMAPPAAPAAQRPGAVGVLARAERPRAHAVRGPGGVLTLDRAAGEGGEARAWLARVLAARRRGARWGDQVLLLRRFAQLPPFELLAAQHSVPLRVEGTPPMARHPAVVEAWSGVALALGDAGRSMVQRERAWRRYLVGPPGVPRGEAYRLARSLAAAGGPTAPLASEHPALLALQRRFERILAAAGDAAAALAIAADAPQRWPAPLAPALRSTLALLEARPKDALSALRAARAAAREAAASAASAAAADAGAAEALLVTSVHRAKGLEWPIVHVPGLNEGTFPASPDPEERRLAYVAWTRARDVLHLYLDARAPESPFIAAGDIEAIAALVRDRAHWGGGGRDVAAAADGGNLAALWYVQEARQRFGPPLER